MFVKKDDYTGRWHIYTAPHTQAIIDGKMRGYKTKEDAEAVMSGARFEQNVDVYADMFGDAVNLIPQQR